MPAPRAIERKPLHFLTCGHDAALPEYASSRNVFLRARIEERVSFCKIARIELDLPMKTRKLASPLLLPLAITYAIFRLWHEAPLAADGTTQAISLDEILEKNLTATHIDLPFDRIENTEKLLLITEPQFKLLARYRATSDGYMRIDLFNGDERVYSEGKDSAGVWEWSQEDDAPMNVHHDGVGALEHGIEFNLFPLAQLVDRGHRIELVDNEKIGEYEYFVLKIVLSDGFETYRYVNPDTWLVDISRDFRAFHPGVDDTKKNLETRYDKWQQSNGVVFAGRSQNIDLQSGEIIGTALVLESNYNIDRNDLDLSRAFVPDRAPNIEIP